MEFSSHGRKYKKALLYEQKLLRLTRTVHLPLPILIIIYAVLVYATYTSISTLVLGLWGDTVMGTVDRYGNQVVNSSAEVNRSCIVSKGYYFFVKGKEYRGRVIYSSDEAWPGLAECET